MRVGLTCAVLCDRLCGLLVCGHCDFRGGCFSTCVAGWVGGFALIGGLLIIWFDLIDLIVAMVVSGGFSLGG